MPRDLIEFPEVPVVVDPVLERLLTGRQMLAEGWCQLTLRAGNSVCARGALTHAGVSAWYYADDTARDADKWLEKFVPAQFAKGGSCWLSPVVRFNNDPNTTQADVLDLFDRAISARKAQA